MENHQKSSFKPSFKIWLRRSPRHQDPLNPTVFTVPIRIRKKNSASNHTLPFSHSIGTPPRAFRGSSTPTDTTLSLLCLPHHTMTQENPGSPTDPNNPSYQHLPRQTHSSVSHVMIHDILIPLVGDQPPPGTTSPVSYSYLCPTNHRTRHLTS